MPKVIAFANQKGGVGKTSAVVNVAGELGRRGKSVFVIDLDAQANTTRWLGEKILSGERARELWLEYRESDLHDFVQDTGFEGIYLLPSSRELNDIEPLMTQMHRRPHEVLKHYLRRLPEEGFEYVLIDTPPSLSALTFNALSAADEVVIPLFSTAQSVDGLFDLREEIDLIREDGLNPHLALGGIFIAFHKHGTNLSQHVENFVKREFEGKMFNTRIRENVRISDSYLSSEPVCYHDPSSNGAKDYHALTDELLERLG